MTQTDPPKQYSKKRKALCTVTLLHNTKRILTLGSYPLENLTDNPAAGTLAFQWRKHCDSAISYAYAQNTLYYPIIKNPTPQEQQL